MLNLVEIVDKWISKLKILDIFVVWILNAMIPHADAFAACPPSGTQQCAVAAVYPDACGPTYCDSHCRVVHRDRMDIWYASNCSGSWTICSKCVDRTTTESCGPC